MSTNLLPRQNWKLVLDWLASTIVGWIIGFFLCMFVEELVYTFTHLNADGAVIGVGIGLIQSYVLKPMTTKKRWWILASIVGFAIGKGVGDYLVGQVGGVLGNALAGAAIGLSSGCTQTLVLNRYVKRAWWWILASVIGWIGGWLIIGTISEAYELHSYLIGSVGAAIVGAVSGITLAMLIREPRTEQPASS